MDGGGGLTSRAVTAQGCSSTTSTWRQRIRHRRRRRLGARRRHWTSSSAGPVRSIRHGIAIGQVRLRFRDAAVVCSSSQCDHLELPDSAPNPQPRLAKPPAPLASRLRWQRRWRPPASRCRCRRRRRRRRRRRHGRLRRQLQRGRRRRRRRRRGGCRLAPRALPSGRRSCALPPLSHFFRSPHRPLLPPPATSQPVLNLAPVLVSQVGSPICRLLQKASAFVSARHSGWPHGLTAVRGGSSAGGLQEAALAELATARKGLAEERASFAADRQAWDI